MDIQKKIDDLGYWDARVVQLECKYFSDEVVLCHEDEEFIVMYLFTGCYKTIFDHLIEYRKSKEVKNMRVPEIPYFLQKISLEESFKSDNRLYICKIEMFPMNVEIWCNDIQIIRKVRENKSNIADVKIV